jgi:galactokinase/mevalonate kinase-like predicted kinase
MITVSCPVRISLIGGPSDLDVYLDKHKKGSVISFTPNLYTYVSVYQDVLGKNHLENKYIVNYSKREEVTNPKDIQNDLVREYLKSSYVDPFSIHMTSDIFSHGSGLAVSSSYSCGLIKTLSELNGKIITEIECGIEAHNLEKKINPLLGYQDVFGCCVGGFKKIEFESDKLPKYTFLPTLMFNFFDVYLYYTGYTRSSTEVLKNVTAPDTDTLNPLVREAEVYLLTQQYYRFMEIIKEGWKEKKRTSKNVLENPKLVELDKHLLEMEGCVAHKLCGAGNGGFFLAFFEKEARVPEGFHKIQPTINGVKRII